MTKRTLAAAAALLLLAGCTTGTVGPINTASVPPVSVGSVHVVLAVKTDHPVTIKYSNGEVTETHNLTDAEVSDDITTKVIEFDAPRPYVAVATSVSEFSGYLSCSLTIDGDAADSSEGSDGTFDMCQAVEDRTGPDEPAPGDHAVELKSTSTSGSVVVWATAYGSAVDQADTGNSTIGTSQLFGPVHMAVVSSFDDDESTCRILIDGAEQASGTTSGLGGIATCTANV